MPDDPKLPPPPDVLRKPQPAAVPPRRRALPRGHSPATAERPIEPLPREGEDGPEKKERQASGLAEMDTAHAFAGVFASGIGRAIAVMATCMLTFGLTNACHQFSMIFEGWRTGGLRGFFHGLVAIPAAPFASPSRFYHAMSWNIGETLLGPPYLMLFVGGLILAVRSEIHIVKLCFFYYLVGAIHAAAYFKMSNPFSLMIWGGMLFCSVWLYRWYWKQQEPEEEEAAGDDEPEHQPGE